MYRLTHSSFRRGMERMSSYFRMTSNAISRGRQRSPESRVVGRWLGRETLCFHCLRNSIHFYKKVKGVRAECPRIIIKTTHAILVPTKPMRTFDDAFGDTMHSVMRVRDPLAWYWVLGVGAVWRAFQACHEGEQQLPRKGRT
jgi:hypothetical protein